MENKISDLQIIPIKPNNGMVGFASLVYDNNFCLSSMGIYTRPTGGYRITYPTKSNDGHSMNYFYPINKSISKVIEDAITSKYEEIMGYNNEAVKEEIINDSQLNTIKILVDGHDIIKDMIFDHYNITELHLLLEKDFNHCIENCLNILKAKDYGDAIKEKFGSDRKINKLLLVITLLFNITSIIYSSEPSKFIEPSKFYSQDFPHKTGMKIISMNTQIAIVDNEVYIGRPRVYVNDSIVLCECGKEAINIKFDSGELYATCEIHSKKYEPVNQLKYPTIKSKKEDSTKAKKQ